MLKTATGSVALIIAPNAIHDYRDRSLCRSSKYTPVPTSRLDKKVAKLANKKILMK